MEEGFGGAVTVDDVDDPDDPEPIQEADPFDSLLDGEPQMVSTQPSQTQTVVSVYYINEKRDCMVVAIVVTEFCIFHLADIDG